MQAKVKAVADAVWARLSGSFSKDVLHAQHVYVFVQILRAGKASKGARECTGCSFSIYYSLYMFKECSARRAAVLLQLHRLCVSSTTCLPWVAAVCSLQRVWSVIPVMTCLASLVYQTRSEACGWPAARRQLDCAGVVTTALAACQRLARQPAHEDLLAVRFQVLPRFLQLIAAKVTCTCVKLDII